ncbi:aminotransferase class I/II-fold pyridoxal phosphate-dependent enzyme [Streptomyces sp. TLI_171]|uniref:aminotransferase class I/II-fold pyridoxal phosphate-dependent enzyme n=1 Tax=Streptomyces sp. TLI_171 TaxID=1938859 RepID=UPI0015D53CC5|nr:aminotransferase class I/II-fold pyridoxal phosphate-dependent enzyme [Streptomyces sp. TLI_171]
MDLPGPPAVGAALRARAGHPAFGYPVAEPADRVLVAQWYRRRHGVEVDPEWVILLPVAPGTAVRLLVEATRPLPGPAVFVTPEWGGFARVCGAAGVATRELPLLPTGDPETAFRLPLEEVAASRPGLVLLSSPHNPTGRLWSAREIRALARAAAPGLLISDEVHGDLRHPDAGAPHPVAVAVTDGAPNVVTLNSVGKTFNVSGVPSCFALVPDRALREQLTAVLAGFGLWEGGLLGAVVQRAALAEGGPWLDGLLEHLVAARELAVAALGGAVLARPRASYLLWLDGSGLGTREELLTQRHVELADGSDFGAAGSGCLRLNFALPMDRLRTALTRLTCESAA